MHNGNSLLRSEKKKKKKGKKKKSTRRTEIEIAAANAELHKKMLTALQRDGLANFLNDLQPDLPEYVAMQEALEHYRGLALLGGWPEVPQDTRLKPDDKDERVVFLRKRLAVTEPAYPALGDPEVYDNLLVAGVTRFQQRHGLIADGEVGPATLKALNITATEKVRRIALNLNRLRQLPEVLPNDYIRVNIAEYDLHLVRDGAEVLNMPVVVGSKKNPTPPMVNKVRHLVFNPYWYPPRTISAEEILPRLQREPEYLENQGFDVLRGREVVDASKIDWHDYNRRTLPYRFRQRPGEKNSLGRVKFIFPNKESVYLHDTPARSLFSQPLRARSHGCVRVGQPLVLAQALMEWDRGWSDNEVREELDKQKRKLRKFKTKMDIYLVYLTARVDEEGVRFPPDIYGHDRPRTDWLEPAPQVAQILDPIHSTSDAVASR